MSTRKAKSTAGEDTAVPPAEPSEAVPTLCGTVHPLPLLSHVTCQRTTGHTDDPPQGCDQDKHHARANGTAYRW